MDVLEEFNQDLARASYVMGHNIEFDVNIVGAEYHRLGDPIEKLTDKPVIDSKKRSHPNFVRFQGGRGGQFKWPTLTELHQKLFNKGFGEAHDAAYDVDATARVFLRIVSIARDSAARTDRAGRDCV